MLLQMGEEVGQAVEAGEAGVRNSRLRDARLARGWTEDDVAAGLCRVAAEVGEGTPCADANQVSKWERGVRTPGRYYAPRLCVLFEVPPDHLGFPAAPRLLAECERLYGMRRRYLLAEGRDAVPGAFDPVARFASGASIVQALEVCITDYWRRDDQYGGETLRPAVMGQLQYALHLLRVCRSPQVLRRLHAIAAELARLVGWMFFDARAYDVARRHFKQAVDIARDAGDRPFVANILASMSLQATYEDDPRASLRLAQAAQDQVGAIATPRLTSMLWMREAFAHAALNDQTGCHAALVAAQRSFDRIRSGDDDPGWIMYFGETKLMADIGIARGRLGEWDAAEPLIELALKQEEPSNRRMRAFHSLWLARSQLRQGKVDQACATASHGLTLASAVVSERISGHAREFQSELLPFAESRPARDFRARLTELIREPRL